MYWSGAAIVLLADVSLRKESRSLDEVVRALRSALGSAAGEDRVWTLEAITTELDKAAGSKVFSTLFEQHGTSKSFPDLTATYRDLGIVVEKDRVRLDDRAPFAAVRRAITGLKER